MPRSCEQSCGREATTYAIDPTPGGWGGFYCDDCRTALKFMVIDQLEVLMDTNKCPYCDYETPDSEEGTARVWQEIAHMRTEHPEIVRKRLEDAGMIEAMVEDRATPSRFHEDDQRP